MSSIQCMAWIWRALCAVAERICVRGIRLAGTQAACVLHPSNSLFSLFSANSNPF